VCWNDSFRKLFGFNRWKSVKELQWHLGELPFEFVYDIYRRKFLKNVMCSPSSISLLSDISNLQYGYVPKLSHKYGDDVSSQLGISVSVEKYYRDSIEV